MARRVRGHAVIGALLACVAVAAVSEAQPSAGRDNAGIRIVEVPGARLATLPTWTLEGPTLVIGDAMGEPEYLLNRAGLSWRLSDGRIIVPNEQMEIRFYDVSGKHIKTVGRRGRGPGEYERLFTIWRYPGDTIHAYDAPTARMDVRSPQGDLVRSYTIPNGVGSSLAWLPAGGLLMLESSRHDLSRVGIWQDSAVIRRVSPTWVKGDTLVIVPSTTWNVFAPGWADGVELAGDPLMFGGAGGAINAHGDQFALNWFDRDGRFAAITRVALPREKVTAADRKAAEDAAAALRARSRQIASEGPPREKRYAEYRPFLNRVRLDVDGRAWVRRWAPANAKTAEWIVFDRQGGPVARVMMPAEFLANDIGRDYLLGLATDEEGVQYVRMYRLRR